MSKENGKKRSPQEAGIQARFRSERKTITFRDFMRRGNKRRDERLTKAGEVDLESESQVRVS
jgi:hypothetical protein